MPSKHLPLIVLFIFMHAFNFIATIKLSQAVIFHILGGSSDILATVL